MSRKGRLPDPEVHTMATILQPVTTARTDLALDAMLGRLERTAARAPHALAVPVMVLHAALSAVAYR
ncbi:hypothetical protein [Curtobacterium pusillum]|uniref:hypothetical protein n=1 Tax=Curtobacterium pusillum TaxID=69373 RepID=UPI0011A62763|nr:hypothetical protein [Curtobacterium pusillum]